MTLNDRDRRVLAEIARQLRADDPELAAALTGSPRRPQPSWAPIHLRALAILLIAVAVLTSAPVLFLAALVVFGIAHLPWTPSPPRSTTAGGDDVSPSPYGS
jgi:hypothetical protein